MKYNHNHHEHSILIVTLITYGECKLYSLSRPSPYAPDFSPECALIVTETKPIFDVPTVKLSDGLQYVSNYVPHLKRSSYYPEEGQVCITYEDINRAVFKAKEALGNYVPPEIHELSSDFPKPEHVAVSAEILLLASKLLANWYQLSRDTIVFGLPRIDTQKTAIREICPTFLLPVKCEISRYRTLTGMCNNLDYPSWGAARSAMVRYLPPVYADGIKDSKVSVVAEGKLPSPRVVSFVVHHDISERDIHITTLLVAWGQMIDHDMTFAATTTDETPGEFDCCNHPPEQRHPDCLLIDIPPNDPFFKFFKRNCMDIMRTMPALKYGCTLGPRNLANKISSYLDAGFVYGSSQETMNRLRAFKGGRMLTSPLYENIGLKDLLPLKTHDADIGCERRGRPKNLYCFDAGDDRVNEQLILTIMHLLWIREHNRIADFFSLHNPHWDDDTIYQETRRIVAAEVQHITFNEFLPIVLGREAMHKYGLDLLADGYYDGYDPKVNGGIRLAFQSAAFRFGHSILPDVTERYNKFHEKLEAIRLSQLLRQPYELYKPGIIDSFIYGMINQEANQMDPQITTEVTNHLFEKPGEHFGLDLAAINMERGREVGIPGYNSYREYCGLPRAKSFHDLVGYFDNTTIKRYANIYNHVDDIDLWSAGVSEYALPGSLLGPTLTCLIAEQFSHIRRGDRFWYENAGWPSQFTPEQLKQIRKVKSARFLCDNADDMTTVQLYPYMQTDPETNPRVECSQLPKMDLSVFNDVAYKGKGKAA
ncbi:peroxidase-like protein [Leptotrombidium deliense]|uniref:Peroxidase-like protein n=1 Tax=Leptotrombidium deliense TaxID=299467 RepID=A0A443SJ47_9ACAR|nr:peroxidase-like protein [Leptotrombidium deliense]